MANRLRLGVVLMFLASIASATDYPKYPAFGTTYEPLDSWVYPAFDRLAALGFTPSAILGIKPWTRLECARLLEEASDADSSSGHGGEAADLLARLREEFAPEIDSLEGGPNRGAGMDSAYLRSMNIAGRPLTDGYHFGQTIINDYGRPYSRGENVVLGGSVEAFDGPFSIYSRSEYQHAPAPPGDSTSVLKLISRLDQVPFPPAVNSSSVDQFRLLDTYATVNLSNTQISFGKESMWWGPDYGSSFLISDNAEPIYMFNVDRITPFKLPWIFSRLGPIRTDLFLGKLSGHHYPPRPWFHGEKFSFKPTQNLEFGFSRTAEFGGVGRALTPAAFLNSYFSPTESSKFRSNENPGKRGAGFDFVYRVPGLRRWLTLYNDSFVNDDPSPLAAPRRAAMAPGVYVPQFPSFNKLDFRAEALYTETPSTPPGTRGRAGTFIYWDNHYRDYYTNKLNLLGSWVGRDAKGFQLWSTYWFSPQNTIQAGFRHSLVDPKFIPGGGTLNDVSGQANWRLRSDLDVTGLLQVERWDYPVLSSTIQHNVTVALQFSFGPKILRSH